MFNKDLYFSNLQTKVLGKNILIFDEVSSTNSYLIDNYGNIGDVVVAKNQSKGKGRSGRSWLTFRDSLAFSVLLPIYDAKYLLPLNILAGFSVVDTLKNYAEVKIKWPNDIVVNGLKVCGMLIDTSFNGSNLEKTVLGIGINIINNDFPVDIKNKATSIQNWSSKEVKKEIILSSILNHLENYINLFINNKLDFVTLWSNYSANINNDINIHINNIVTKYKEIGINNDGCLIVLNSSGVKEIILSGEIGYDFGD